MLKVDENSIFGWLSRKEKSNTDKQLTYIQKNIEILVGRLKEKYGMLDTGINGKSVKNKKIGGHGSTQSASG